MRARLLWRFLLFSFASVVVFGGLSLITLNYFSSVVGQRHHAEFIRWVSDAVEKSIRELAPGSLSDDEFRERVKPVLGSMEPPPPLHFSPPPNHRRLPRPDIWLIDADGRILSGRYDHPLPEGWKPLTHALAVHSTASETRWLSTRPNLYATRIENPRELYLISTDPGPPAFGPMFIPQVLMILSTLTLALTFSLSVVFFYLRRKSLEARTVLSRLEHGDLKARFEIDRFDEFSGLLLDFNRMANEIERLVERIRTTESARKNLLQELGHDIRTPITSLTTAFETLHKHLPRLSEEQKRELLDMSSAEVGYLKDLVEKLMTIAAIDEPSYKSTFREIDLGELLNAEIATRRSGETRGRQWQVTGADKPILVSGDLHLMLRLFKNGLDNSSRFAREGVKISVCRKEGFAHIHVDDDGPGLSEEDLHSFGRRREQRQRRDCEALEFSLGLGSIIMRAIADQHGGSLAIQNRPEGGARLSIVLPLSQN